MANSKLQPKPGIEKAYKVLISYLSKEPGT